MKQGGYHIVDFKDTALSAESVTIPGIYESIEGSLTKPILISGVILDGVEQRDCFVIPDSADGSYTISAYGKTITITSADGVTIA